MVFVLEYRSLLKKSRAGGRVENPCAVVPRLRNKTVLGSIPKLVTCSLSFLELSLSLLCAASMGRLGEGATGLGFGTYQSTVDGFPVPIMVWAALEGSMHGTCL